MMRYLVSVFIVISVAAGISFAQVENKKGEPLNPSSSPYLISAKAGGVSFVTGQVYIIDKNGVRKNLSNRSEISADDTVVSGENGRAEILLNPGSYIRLAENSAFRFKTTDVENLGLELLKGSAIFEVITFRDYSILAAVGKTNYYFVNSGVYRIDVNENGTGRIAVWKGSATIENPGASSQTIKSGQTLDSTYSQSAIAKFDKNKLSDFDSWSKERAKELAKRNAVLTKKRVRSSLISSMNNDTWLRSIRTGFWIYDSMYGYSYLPFVYGVSSPYGYNYSRNIWSYPIDANNLPPNIYYSIYGRYNRRERNNNNNSSTPTTNTGSQNVPSTNPPPTTSVPPRTSPSNPPASRPDYTVPGRPATPPSNRPDSSVPSSRVDRGTSIRETRDTQLPKQRRGIDRPIDQ